MLKSLQRNQGSVQTEQGQSGIASRAAMFTQPVAPLNLQAPKAPLTQTTVKRSLPTPPVKSTQSVGAASTASQAPQFFPPAVELPQPPEGGDINVQVRHWARISGSKYNPQQIALALENAKKLIDTGLVDFTSTAPKGNTAIHNAALVNNAAFIDYVMTHEKYLGKIDIDLYNTQANSNALGAAITSDFFELAIRLIKNYNAKVFGEVRLIRNDCNLGKKVIDNTCDFLRLAFIACLATTDDQFSAAQKKSLDQLIKLLIDKKLNFFQTKKSFLPAAIEIEHYWITASDMQTEIMQRSSLNNEEFSKVLLLDKFKINYPEAFQAFWEQLKTEKNSGNNIAQTFWRIWHARELVKGNQALCCPK